MSDSTPAPLTSAERVALRIAAQTLRQAAETLRREWYVFEEKHPDKATSEVCRGYLMAIHRIGHMADDIERNANG